MNACACYLTVGTIFSLIGATAATSRAQSQNPSGTIGSSLAPPTASTAAAPGLPYPSTSAPAATQAQPPVQSVPPPRPAPYPTMPTPNYATGNSAPPMPEQGRTPTGYRYYAPARPAYTARLPAPNDSVSRQSPVTDWSIGAGVQYTSFADSAMGTLNTSISSTAGLAAPSIRASVFLERRLWNHVYFLFQPDFDYRKYYRGSSDAKSSLMVDRSTSAGLSAGLRWVANPGAPVELGMTHLIDADWTYATASGPRYRTVEGTTSAHTNVTMFAYDIGVSTGVVAEYKLMSQLWLRIHVAFLRAAFGKARVKYVDDDSSSSLDTDGNFNLSLFAAPRLELRLTW
jgi:hypothetical protein